MQTGFSARRTAYEYVFRGPFLALDPVRFKQLYRQKRNVRNIFKVNCLVANKGLTVLLIGGIMLKLIMKYFHGKSIKIFDTFGKDLRTQIIP